MTSQKNDLFLISSYLKKYQFRIAAVFIALFFSAFSVLAVGFTLRYFVNESFVDNNLDNLGKISIILASIVLILAISSALRSKLINSVSERIAADIRLDLYQILLSKSILFFETNKIADMLARIFGDVQLIQGVITTIFSFFVRNMILLLGGICLLFYTNFALTIYTLLVIPVVILPAVIMIRKIRIHSRTIQDNLALMAGHVEETLSAIKLVQSSNAAQYELSNFSILVKNYLRSSSVKESYRSVLVAALFSLVGFAVLVILYLGGQSVITGVMSSGDLVSFIFYSVVVASSAGGMSEVVADLAKIAGAKDRIAYIFAHGYDSKNDSVNQYNILSVKFHSLEFQDVGFSYPGRPQKVLDRLSFVIEKGDKVALVGDSGSGKSTVVNLIQKFYAPNNGKILINNSIDLQECDDAGVRKLVGVVSQETFIFSNSVFYNIAYGKPNTNMNDIINAAKIANIHDFVMSLPKQYDTHLGEKGVQLSGGQRQRIAIARIIISNPEILILDEATSNLDDDNAESIQNAIDRIMRGRTTLVISHRLSLIEKCDKIIKIKNH